MTNPTCDTGDCERSSVAVEVTSGPNGIAERKVCQVCRTEGENSETPIKDLIERCEACSSDSICEPHKLIIQTLGTRGVQ